MLSLHEHDTTKMINAREYLSKKLPKRRAETKEIDRQIYQYVKQVPLVKDEQIIVFLEAISNALIPTEEEIINKIKEQQKKELKGKGDLILLFYN